MLPNDFDTLAESARRFGIADALQQIRLLIQAHPSWDLIDTRDLGRLVPIDPVTLARAVHFLVSAGILRQRYGVTTPTGSLADQWFDEPTQIPQRLPDRFENYFDTAEQDIVTVLVAPRP